MADPHELEAASVAQHHGHGPGVLELDPGLSIELGLIDVLHRLERHVAPLPPAQVERIRLSAVAVNPGFRGNPFEWTGWSALSIAVYNRNAFVVYVGDSGGGTLESRKFVVPAQRLVVLPFAGDVYSIGTDAANLAGGEADLVVMRFADVRDPAVYALA
jgi:hypothetical protein